MMIPQVGDWIICFTKSDQGKVFRVDLGKKKAWADFFREDDVIGCTAEEEVSFADIEKIITDPVEKDLLERELNGEDID